MHLMIEGPTHQIKVKFVTATTLRKHVGDSKTEHTRGVFFPDQNEIYILKGMSDEESLHVLLHEAVHAANWQLSTQADEEARTDAMATWMARLFKVAKAAELLT